MNRYDILLKKTPTVKRLRQRHWHNRYEMALVCKICNENWNRYRIIGCDGNIEYFDKEWQRLYKREVARRAKLLKAPRGINVFGKQEPAYNRGGDQDRSEFRAGRALIVRSTY